MKIITKQFTNKETECELLDFVESAILNTGYDNQGEIERLSSISKNTARALSLVICALAKQGNISAKEIAALDTNYYSSSRFE